MLKKSKVTIIVVLFATFLFIFVCWGYKTLQRGKNMNGKSKIMEYLANIHSYEAKINVTVVTKKTTNQYVLMQYFAEPDYAKQIAMEPRNIANIETIYSNKTLTIKNTNLGLTKIYENYPYVNGNTLWLSSFLDTNMEQFEIEENDKEIILKTDYHSYNCLKVLHICKDTRLPGKMEVIDNSTQTKIYIEYKEIKLNTIQENSIVAFRKLDHTKEVLF